MANTAFPNIGAVGPALFLFGPLSFNVLPLSIESYDHLTGSEFARKPIMQSIPAREWTGESDEELIISGMVAPLRFGGFANLEQLNSMRLTGVAQPLVRGSAPAIMMGWFVCERLERRHTDLDSGGIGKLIHFQAQFARVSMGDPTTYYYNLQKVIL